MANVKDLLVNGSARVIGTIYGNATSANKVNHSLTFGSKSFNGSSAQTITLADLGGKPTQSAVSSPSASGTEISFIDTISQNANGVITATKKTVRDASASQSGVVSTGAQTFAGNKTFANGITLGSNITMCSVGTPSSYPYVGNKITWDGGTDGAQIYYQIDSSDAGRLVLNTTDDTNCLIALAYNGTAKSYINTSTPSFYPSSNNTGSIGLSSNKWASMYATTFYGALSGNATTATGLSSIIANDKLPDRLREYHSNGMTLDSTACGWYYAGSNNTSPFTTASDFMVMNQGYNTSWGSQIATDFRSNRLAVRNKNNGTWNSWVRVLDQNTGVARAHFGTTSGSEKYVLITINKEIHWMLNFTIKLYQSYVATDIQVSGYNYGSNHWYSPNAIILGSTTTNGIKVYFGYTGDFKLWVAVDGGDYTGVDVLDAVNGYQQISLDDAFTITRVSALPGTLQSTITAYRPYYRNETVSNATTATNLAASGTWTWSNGTTAGPTASLVLGGKTTSVGAIPSASSSISGIITTGDQSFAGIKTFTNKIVLKDGDQKGAKIGAAHITTASTSNGEVVLQNGHLRFGGSGWDYNQWAGLKYDHSNKKIVLGLADGSEFIANSAQSGGTLKFVGISTVDLNKTASIKNLAVGGGIYWDPYVESASDASDAASITVLKSGVAGGTELRISQANDANDIVNLSVPTNDAARINNNIILNAANYTNYNIWNKIKSNNRFYPLVGNAYGSAWYKVTWPFPNTHSANRWMMLSMDITLGGPYSPGPSGKIQLSYYFSYNSTNAAWSANNVYGVVLGNNINSTNVQIKYSITEPNIMYIKAGPNQYRGISIENLHVHDSAPSYDFLTTKIETCAEPDSTVYNSSVPLVFYGSDNGITAKIDNNLTLGGSLTVGSASIGTNGYITGTWLKTTGNSNGTGNFVTQKDGWLYYRTPAETRGDINAPSTTGAGASGTWGISITGNAATATNADKLDGYHENSFLRYRDTVSGSGGTSHSNSLWSQIGIRQYNNALPDAMADNATYTYGAVISLPGQNSRLDIWYNHQTSSNGDGLRYRTGWNDDKKTWATILDSVNYGTIADGRYVKKSGDTMTGALTTPNLFVVNDSSNSGYDALAYFRHYSNNDWAVIIDKNNAYDYGLDIRTSTGSAMGLRSNGQMIINSTCGSYREGIRLRGADGAWNTIILGATSDSGTNEYAWSIHRKNDNNFCISRNSSNGENGLVLTTNSRCGIGTTAPSYKLHVTGDIYADGGWLRTSGNAGWHSESYGGGWYMTDSTYLRSYNNKMVYSGGKFLSPSTASSWIDGQRYARGGYNLEDATDNGSYWPWMRQTNSNTGRWFSFGTLGNSFYWIGSSTSRTSNGYDNGMEFNVSNGYLTGCSRVYGAVWNDYAEYRKSDITEPGRIVIENGDGTLSLSTKRLQRGAEVISDTFGFAIGETDECKTPIAATGRVLAYTYEPIEEYRSKTGWPVCSGPNGTVSIMTEEEEEKYPSRIIGTISEVPNYEEWGTGKVKINGRVWIRIK